MTDKIVILSTCSSSAEAESIARALLEKRLAACVNIVNGVRSLYRWRGAVEEATELLLVIKTRRDLVTALRAELERMHTYEVPELLALGVLDGAPAYLDWLERELGPQE